jgi:hypothetical protein
MRSSWPAQSRPSTLRSRPNEVLIPNADARDVVTLLQQKLDDELRALDTIKTLVGACTRRLVTA